MEIKNQISSKSSNENLKQPMMALNSEKIRGVYKLSLQTEYNVVDCYGLQSSGAQFEKFNQMNKCQERAKERVKGLEQHNS